jgi:hypothetical protein
MFEFGMRVCIPCYGLLIAIGKDLQDRIKFPDDSQVVMYKVKRYVYPPKTKKKKLEDWKLFSALHRKGKKEDY